jgi:hypothetical protein
MKDDRLKTFYAALILTVAPTVAFADSWDVVAHVTQLEPSDIPNMIYFAIDQDAGSCAAGPWLVFSGNSGSSNLPDSVKAIFAGLQAALLSGLSVEVYGTSTGCVVSNVHFLNH